MKQYKKDSSYSYSLGIYTTIELLSKRPNQVKNVFIHSEYKGVERLQILCDKNSIEIKQDDKLFNRLSQKENNYVLGVFSKYACKLSGAKPHVVLVNPSDMGNLGTIIRTLAGVNITNLAIITPAADYWNPKTIRASMGALFHLNIESFSSFIEYRKCYDSHSIYPFMLDGEVVLNLENCPRKEKYSLVFGNEASGLTENFRNEGLSVQLPQSGITDSYNLAVSTGIGAFIFAKTNGQI